MIIEFPSFESLFSWFVCVFIYVMIHEILHHIFALLVGFKVKGWVLRKYMIGVQIDFDETKISMRKIKYKLFLVMSAPFLCLPIMFELGFLAYRNNNVDFAVHSFIMIVYGFFYSCYESSIIYLKNIREIKILKTYDVV